MSFAFKPSGGIGDHMVTLLRGIERDPPRIA
jgi:hypothetical protein